MKRFDSEQEPASEILSRKLDAECQCRFFETVCTIMGVVDAWTINTPSSQLSWLRLRVPVCIWGWWHDGTDAVLET